MTVFISYARTDRASVQTMRRDLERARLSVWLDDELTGGQQWWDTILGEIRKCELFVVALSPDSLRSKACQAEFRYAQALNRPLLAVLVRPVNIQLTPSAIANSQIVDYTERNADSAVALVTAAAARPPAPPLPPMPPPAPAPPMSYMNPYREQIQSGDLSFRDQSQLVLQLRTHLQDDEERDTARELLLELRRRPDVVESVGRDIDELLASVPARAASPDAAAERTAEASTVAAATSTPAATGPPPGWHPDPTGRFEARYWDGSHWTDHVSTQGRTSTDSVKGRPAATVGSTAPMTAAAPSLRAGGEEMPALSTGAFTWLLIGAVLTGVIGIVAGAVNLKHPARKGQAQTLLWVGIAFTIILFAVAGSSGSQ